MKILLITVIILIVYLSLLGLQKALKENKAKSKGITLKSNCPQCGELITEQDSLKCDKCNFDLNQKVDLSNNSNITCPNCTAVFNELLTKCPECGEYEKLTHHA